MAAKIKLTVQSNFAQAEKDLKSFGTLTEAEAKRIEKALEKVKGAQIESFIQKTKRAGIAISATQGKMAGLKSENLQLQRKMEMLIKNGIDPQDKALEELQKEYIRTASAIKKMEEAEEAQQAMMKASVITAKALAVALVAVSTYGAKAQADYAKQLANINTLLPISEAQIDSLNDSITNLSNTYAISKEELSGGVYQALSAGAEDLSAALVIVEHSARLGKAALIENGQAVDIITTAMNAYGKENVSAAKASNVFFQIIKKGKINGEQLASTIGQSITLFKSANLSIEDLGAGLATMTKVGVKASEATTQLNAIVGSFLKPSEDMTKALERAGFASGSALLEQRGLAGAMKFLKEQTEGSKEELAKLLPSIRAMRGAMALSAEDGEVFNKVLEDFVIVSGATDEALRAQTEGFAKNVFTTEQAIIALQNLAMEIGEKVLPVIGKMAGFIVKATTGFTELSVPMQLLLKMLPALAFGIGAVMFALNAGAMLASITSAIGLLSTAFGVLNLIIQANPIGAVIALVGTLALAINGLTDVIVGNMNAQSDAIGKWATAGTEEYSKMIENLKLYEAYQAKGSARTKEESGAMKALKKSIETTTGAKLKYDKVTKKAAIDQKGFIQDIEHLEKVNWAVAKNAKKRADLLKAQADAKADIDKANKDSLDATKSKEEALAEARKKAQVAYVQGKQEALMLSERVQQDAVLGTMNAAEKEVFFIEQKYKKEEALLLKYYDSTSKVLEDLRAQKAQALSAVSTGDPSEGGDTGDTSLTGRLATEKSIRYEAQQQMLQDAQVFAQLTADMEIGTSEKKIEAIKEEMLRIKELTTLGSEEKIAAKKALEEQILAIEKNAAMRSAEIFKAKLQSFATMATGLGDLFGALDKIMKNAGKKSKAFAVAQKAMAIASIAIETARGIATTIGTMGMPLAIPFVALASAVGLAQGIVVASTPIPSAETGGRFEVPESGMHRSDGTMMKLNPGEVADITPRGEESSNSLTARVILNDQVLWESTQRGIDSGEITFTDANLVGA